jgi:hypothetical protein
LNIKAPQDIVVEHLENRALTHTLESPHLFWGYYGTTEQLAEKAGVRKGNHPAAAKAGLILRALRHD